MTLLVFPTITKDSCNFKLQEDFSLAALRAGFGCFGGGAEEEPGVVGCHTDRMNLIREQLCHGPCRESQQWTFLRWENPFNSYEILPNLTVRISSQFLPGWNPIQSYGEKIPCILLTVSDIVVHFGWAPIWHMYMQHNIYDMQLLGRSVDLRYIWKQHISQG